MKNANVDNTIKFIDKKDNIVVISNYVGFSIECALAQGIKDLTIVGHIGKLSKIAFGCFNTHSRVSDVRLEVIALELTLMGYDLELVQKVLDQKTSEGAVRLLGEDFPMLYERIGEKVLKRLDITTILSFLYPLSLKNLSPIFPNTNTRSLLFTAFCLI